MGFNSAFKGLIDDDDDDNNNLAMLYYKLGMFNVFMVTV